jgi:hypothetical protein
MRVRCESVVGEKGKLWLVHGWGFDPTVGAVGLGVRHGFEMRGLGTGLRYV